MSYLQLVIHCGESFAIISDILRLFSFKYFAIISDIFTYLSRQLKSATSKISPLSPIFLGYHNEMSGLYVGTEKYPSYFGLSISDRRYRWYFWEFNISGTSAIFLRVKKIGVTDDITDDISHFALDASSGSGLTQRSPTWSLMTILISGKQE